MQNLTQGGDHDTEQCINVVVTHSVQSSYLQCCSLVVHNVDEPQQHDATVNDPLVV